MIRNYQNELIIAVAFFVLAGGFLYQRGVNRKLAASLERSKTTALQITEAKTLQKVWFTKGLKQKVSALRGLVPSSKIKAFNQKKKKLLANYNNLTAQELNTVSTKLASLPVQIQELAITRTGDKYTMRCTCSW